MKTGMEKIARTSTIKSIIEQYSAAKDVFIANGLADLVDDDKLDKIGSFLTLESALKMKNKDLHVFLKLLLEKTGSSGKDIDITLAERRDQAQWDVIGHLPLPVRLQILEAFEASRTQFHEKEGLSFSVKFESGREAHDLIDAICDDEGDPRLLPDIIFTEGFDCLLEQSSRDRLINTDIFGRALPWEENSVFKGIGLNEPKNKYNILAIIPALFVVDTTVLAGLPVPCTWKDLFSRCYEKLIAMPERSVALFKSVLLTLYARFGEEGVLALARNTAMQLHPSLTAKLIGSDKKERPAISIMPYFFAKMVPQTDDIRVVWPEDGAISAPVYIIVKSDPEFYRSDPGIVEHVVDFFTSRQMGELFTKGGFPSVHPAVDNALPKEASFQWIGWEFLEEKNSETLISQIYDLFDEEIIRMESK